MADRTLSIKISGDSKDLSRALGSASKDVDRFGKKSSTGGKLAKGLGLAAGGAALGGIALLGKGIMDGVKTAVEHEKALAQTNAVIKSTGGGAKVTAKDILGLSDKIEKMTGIDDLATQAGANMLLTFTNIKNGAGSANKVFDQSVKVLGDMTTALGSDPQKQAIQLGKALNDPVKGISALSRVGVTFTAQQKENIKAMVAHGNTAGAQKLILAELTKEFGGSAQAAGGTMAGQLNILKAHLEDTEQVIGQKILPVLNQLIQWAITNFPTFQKYAAIAMQEIQTAWVTYGQPTFTAIRTVVAALVGWVRTNWDAISGIFKGAFQVIEGIVKLFIAVFKGDWGAAWAAIKQIVTGAFDVIENTIRLAGPLLLAAAKAVGAKILQGMKDGVSGLADAALAGLKALPGAFLDLHVILGKAALSLGQAIVGKIVDAFSGLGGALVGMVKSAINSAIGVLNSGFNQISGHWPDIPGAPGPPFGRNPIPTLAAGGIVKARPGGMLAILGEGGRDEAVIPLSRGGGMGGAGGGSHTFNFYGWVADKQEVVDAIRNELIRTGRNTTGGALGGFA